MCSGKSVTRWPYNLSRSTSSECPHFETPPFAEGCINLVDANQLRRTSINEIFILH